MRVHIGAIGSAEGVGTSKRQAEQAAAEAMLAAMAQAIEARKEKSRARRA
jgi:dsRNA-specific ribonuclease